MKTLNKIILTSLIGAGSFNSYSQDTLRNEEGYKIFNKKNQLISEVREGYSWKEGYEWKEVYEYNKGRLKKLTFFNNGVKIRLYRYNKKGQLTKKRIFYEEVK